MLTRLAGLALALSYAALIVWLYGTQPRTMAEVTGGLTASIGAYEVDAQARADGLAFFRHDQFAEARAALERADPARRDATVQFYIAYSYYRQGWGRLYHDDALFKLGIEAVDRAIAVAPGNRVVVDDPDLGMRTADELRAELQRGLTREAADFNPLRVLKERK
jgi:hypothetical protein